MLSNYLKKRIYQLRTIQLWIIWHIEAFDESEDVVIIDELGWILGGTLGAFKYLDGLLKNNPKRKIVIIRDLQTDPDTSKLLARLVSANDLTEDQFTRLNAQPRLFNREQTFEYDYNGPPYARYPRTLDIGFLKGLSE